MRIAIQPTTDDYPLQPSVASSVERDDLNIWEVGEIVVSVLRAWGYSQDAVDRLIDPYALEMRQYDPTWEPEERTEP